MKTSYIHLRDLEQHLSQTKLQQPVHFSAMIQFSFLFSIISSLLIGEIIASKVNYKEMNVSYSQSLVSRSAHYLPVHRPSHVHQWRNWEVGWNDSAIRRTFNATHRLVHSTEESWYVIVPSRWRLWEARRKFRASERWINESAWLVAEHRWIFLEHEEWRCWETHQRLSTKQDWNAMDS